MSEHLCPPSDEQLSTLQMLLNQQLSEYREIKDLREKLRAAEMRHQALADEIQRVLTALPLSGDLAISLTPAGPAPASTIPSAGGGFSAVDALVEAQRNSRRFRDRVDAAFDEAARVRRGNPLYDLEWAT